MRAIRSLTAHQLRASYHLAVASLILLMLIALALLLSTLAGHAEDVGALVTPPSFWLVFAEPITMLLGIAITAAFAWLTPKLAKLIGQEQANKLQESFQEAAKRAAGMAFLKLSPIAGAVFSTSDPTAKKMAVDDGVAYLKRTMPDTIKKLGTGDETLRQVVEANLGQILAGK